MNKVKLCIIAPCYNEEEILLHSYNMLSDKLNELIQSQLITEDSRILFVDDGSKDKTWSIIEQLSLENSNCFSLKLSKNYGHQYAIVAGMEHVYSISKNAKQFNITPFDAIITIDADIQDDLNAINEMIIKLNEGNEIVFGVKQGRDSDSIFKRMTAEGFYKIMEKLGVKLIFNHADFRLVSIRVLSEFLRYQENNPFLRGIFANMGFKTDNVYYDISDRIAGQSKFTLKKMLKFAWGGITSYSDSVLRIPIYLGFITLMCSIILLVQALYAYFIGSAVSGWTSLLIVMLFFFSTIMFILAIQSNYIGKIYMELKNRPRYHVDKVNDDTNKK